MEIARNNQFLLNLFSKKIAVKAIYQFDIIFLISSECWKINLSFNRRIFHSFQIILSDDPLLRIQAEISEVEKREIELRNEHRDLALKTAENTPPVSPTNSDKTNEDQQSDDSGFVVSPSVAKKFESKNNFKKNKVVTPAAQPVTTLHKPMVLTRAMSTPQLFQVSPLKKFNMNPSQKGIMQRFIASRGKIVQQNQTNHFQSNLIMVSSITDLLWINLYISF